MRFDTKIFALTCGVLWAAMVLLMGLANLVWQGYAHALLVLLASIYPGYDAGASLGQVLVGTIYALVDGVVGGWVFAWVHNRFAARLAGRPAA